jgi:hypothetical protein
MTSSDPQALSYDDVINHDVTSGVGAVVRWTDWKEGKAGMRRKSCNMMGSEVRKKLLRPKGKDDEY